MIEVKFPQTSIDSDTQRRAARWARQRVGRIGHERRVMSLALGLFDLTRDFHKLQNRHRNLLLLGALLHDVGRSVDHKNHPAIGAAIILKDAKLPLRPRDRRRVAYLARYHRGAVPKIRFDEILQSGDSRKAMRCVLAILRAADGLDSRTIRPPRIGMSIKGQKLQIVCSIDSENEKATRVLGRRKKFRLLEELLGLKIQIRIKPTLQAV